MLNLTKVVLPHALFRRQDGFLSQVPHAGSLRHGDMPGAWNEMTTDGLQERGFTSAIGPSNHQPSTLGQLKGHWFLKAPGNGDVFHRHQLG